MQVRPSSSNHLTSSSSNPHQNAEPTEKCTQPIFRNCAFLIELAGLCKIVMSKLQSPPSASPQHSNGLQYTGCSTGSGKGKEAKAALKRHALSELRQYEKKLFVF